ncbi:MAG: amidohydrolase family protein, partial [Proteobacteria bacterium]|nr:amidohydrolase family protein [Pseudomonadota bacterium]
DRDGNRGWPTLPPTSDGGVTTIDASPDRHLAACEPVDKTFVLGFESAYLDVSIPNDQVADYVRMHPGKLIGFAGVDPAAASEAVEAVIRAHDELGMRGLALAPAAQDFHPSASRACAIYEAAIEMGLPILFHSGPHFAPRCKLEYARPLLLDEVAAHLDGDHRASLFHEISDMGAQAWLTGVDRSVFAPFGDGAQFIAVDAGAVTPE